MKTYIVTYRKSYPGANECTDEELQRVAFVFADSFQDAENKVTKRFKGEFESVRVIAISIDEKATIIV